VNILVVDDDPATIAVVGRALDQDGVRVVDASNGLDGLRLARAHEFDLIICDLRMPGLDGFTVIAALHDDPTTSGVPVLVLTSHDLTRDERNRLAGKTLDVITKGDDTAANLQQWLERITELTNIRQLSLRDALSGSTPGH
jgi:CheY-like chemotaxis protein